jgi:hypothetical protein
MLKKVIVTAMAVLLMTMAVAPTVSAESSTSSALIDHCNEEPTIPRIICEALEIGEPFVTILWDVIEYEEAFAYATIAFADERADATAAVTFMTVDYVGATPGRAGGYALNEGNLACDRHVGDPYCSLPALVASPDLKAPLGPRESTSASLIDLNPQECQGPTVPWAICVVERFVESEYEYARERADAAGVFVIQEAIGAANVAFAWYSHGVVSTFMTVTYGLDAVDDHCEEHWGSCNIILQ